MKKIVVAVMILLIIGGLAGGAYVFLMTDIFKTPDQLFKKYLVSSIIDLGKVQYEPYGNILSRSSKEPMELKYVSTDSSENNKIEVNYLSNSTDNSSKLDLSMIVEGNDYFTGSLIIDKEIFGIQFKDIHDKYLALENRDLKVFAQNLGVEEDTIQNVPDEINFSNKLTEDEKTKLIEILTKYISQINSAITEENYIVEKQVSVELNNQNLVTDKYSLIMDEKEFYTLILNTVLKLLDDEKFLAICNERVDNESIEKVKHDITEVLNDLEEQTRLNQIKFSIYVENKKTKKCEIIQNDGTIEWFLENNNEAESSFTIKTISKKTSSNQVGSESIFKINNKYENNIGLLTIEEKTTYNQKDVKELEKEFSNLFSSNEEYENSQTKTIISSQFNENTITGEIILEGFKTEENQEEMTNKFEINFNSEFEIEKLDLNNSVILNDYSTSDFEKLGTELITNALETAIDKPNSLIGSLSMFLQFFAPQTDDVEEIENNNWDDGELILDSNEIAMPAETDEKENIYMYILNGLNQSLTEYKDEVAINENANLGDFLTVENVQEECPESYNLELIDGTTMKCIINNQNNYYITMNINGDTLLVDEIQVYTEEEYLNL